MLSKFIKLRSKNAEAVHRSPLFSTTVFAGRGRAHVLRENAGGRGATS